MCVFFCACMDRIVLACVYGHVGIYVCARVVYICVNACVCVDRIAYMHVLIWLVVCVHVWAELCRNVFVCGVCVFIIVDVFFFCGSRVV